MPDIQVKIKLSSDCIFSLDLRLFLFLDHTCDLWSMMLIVKNKYDISIPGSLFPFLKDIHVCIFYPKSGGFLVL